MSNPLIVGIDVHSRTNRTCLLDREGEPWGKRFSTANNRPGTQTLIGRLVEALQQGQFDSLRVALEATNWYWFPLYQALSQDPALAPWPQTFYPFNPRVTARYKDSFSDKDKSDDSDAYIVADRLRTYNRQELPAPFAPDLRYLSLRFLTRYRYHLVKDLVREKNSVGADITYRPLRAKMVTAGCHAMAWRGTTICSDSPAHQACHAGPIGPPSGLVRVVRAP